MATGQNIADTAIKKMLVKKVIYTQSDLLSVGLKVVPTVNLDALDIRFTYPSEVSGAYPVADDAVTPREKVTWSTFDINLKKAQTHYFITDSAKLRSVQGVQNTINARRAAEALAKLKDGDIIYVLKNGVNSGNQVTAGAYWTAATGDPEKDIIDAWNLILANSNASETDLSNVAVICRAGAYGALTKLSLIGNVQQTIKTYLKNSFGIDILPSRDSTNLSTSALVILKGDMTAQHGVLSDRAASAAGVPLVEHERVIGSGDDYLVTQWFKTAIIEDGSATGKNDRIAEVTGTVA